MSGEAGSPDGVYRDPIGAQDEDDEALDLSSEPENWPFFI